MPVSVIDVLSLIAFGAPARLPVELVLDRLADVVLVLVLAGSGPPGSPARAIVPPHMLQNFASSVFCAPHA